MHTITKPAAILAALAAASTLMSAMAADTAAPASAASSPIDAALQPTEELLALMDTDHSGKVSREEFMRFMEAEFDRLDKNKDGLLDLNELRLLLPSLRHPARGPGR
jgi:hypothetical protein